MLIREMVPLAVTLHTSLPFFFSPPLCPWHLLPFLSPFSVSLFFFRPPPPFFFGLVRSLHLTPLHPHTHPTSSSSFLLFIFLTLSSLSLCVRVCVSACEAPVCLSAAGAAMPPPESLVTGLSEDRE